MGRPSHAGSASMLRSIRREDQVRSHKLSRGTARRVLAFARPFRRDIVVFLVAVVVDAAIGVATPVLAGRVINAITRGGSQAAGAVVRIAILIAALAIVDAMLSLVQRWYSARIGEGSIYRLRTQVYDHVQRMPLQFFTRTQTGALVSRLNNDVIGAQQAFTSTLSGVVSQRHPARADRRRHVLAVVADHRAVAGDAAAVRAGRPAGSAADSRPSPASPTSSTRR